MSVVSIYDEDDLRALAERLSSGSGTYQGDQNALEVKAVVAEVLAHRRTARNEARRDVMMMAAAIASTLANQFDAETTPGREHIAKLAVALAFEIEKVTPR